MRTCVTGFAELLGPEETELAPRDSNTDPVSTLSNSPGRSVRLRGEAEQSRARKPPARGESADGLLKFVHRGHLRRNDPRSREPVPPTLGRA